MLTTGLEHFATVLTAFGAFVAALAAWKSSKKNESHITEIKLSLNGRLDELTDAVSKATIAAAKATDSAAAAAAATAAAAGAIATATAAAAAKSLIEAKING